MPATAPTLPCPGITPSRPSALGLAARWVGVTNLALLGLILLVAFGGTLGRWPLVVSSALLSAAPDPRRHGSADRLRFDPAAFDPAIELREVAPRHAAAI